MNYWNREKRKNKQTVDDPSPSRRLGKSNGAKLYIYVKHKIIIERYELGKWIRLTLLAVQWGWVILVILVVTFAAKQDSASKATKGPPIYIYIITGVQASGVILDRLFRQCCFVWSEIVGPHSSRSFNDNECGPTISHHTIQHCRNKRMKPEILWLLIVKALQLNELSDLRNTFHPEFKYSYIYIYMIQFPRPHVGGQFWVEALQRLCSIGGLPSNKTDREKSNGLPVFPLWLLLGCWLFVH